MEVSGVVVWSNLRVGALIVWCADCEGLAFASGGTIQDAHQFNVGDLVDVAYCKDQSGRRVCTRVVLRNRGASLELADMLKSTGADLVKGRSGKDAAPVATRHPFLKLVS